MHASVRMIVLMTMVAAASCGGTSYGSTGPANSPTTGAGSTSNSVSVGDDYFSPAATTAPIGTSMTWTWSGSKSHNVTLVDGIASTTQATGTFARTFTAAGTYLYHCTVHGTAMSGSVKVQ